MKIVFQQLFLIFFFQKFITLLRIRMQIGLRFWIRIRIQIQCIWIHNTCRERRQWREWSEWLQFSRRIDSFLYIS